LRFFRKKYQIRMPPMTRARPPTAPPTAPPMVAALDELPLELLPPLAGTADWVDDADVVGAIGDVATGDVATGVVVVVLVKAVVEDAAELDTAAVGDAEAFQ